MNFAWKYILLPTLKENNTFSNYSHYLVNALCIWTCFIVPNYSHYHVKVVCIWLCFIVPNYSHYLVNVVCIGTCFIVPNYPLNLVNVVCIGTCFIVPNYSHYLVNVVCMFRLNNSFPCFMNFEARGAAESFKVHKTWKTSVLSIREK